MSLMSTTDAIEDEAGFAVLMIVVSLIIFLAIWLTERSDADTRCG